MVSLEVNPLEWSRREKRSSQIRLIVCNGQDFGSETILH
jgi:hypothetical protein